MGQLKYMSTDAKMLDNIQFNYFYCPIKAQQECFLRKFDIT